MLENTELENYSTLKERIITLVLILCFLSWSLPVANIRIYQLKLFGFGPFQNLSIFFWLILTIVCYFNLIPTNKNNKFFSSFGFSLIISFSLGIFLLFPRIYSDYWPTPTINRKIVVNIKNFSNANYIADIFATVSDYIFPLMVIPMAISNSFL